MTYESQQSSIWNMEGRHIMWSRLFSFLNREPIRDFRTRRPNRPKRPLTRSVEARNLARILVPKGCQIDVIIAATGYGVPGEEKTSRTFLAVSH